MQKLYLNTLQQEGVLMRILSVLSIKLSTKKINVRRIEMKTKILLSLGIFLFVVGSIASEKHDEKVAVRKAIVEGYINGIFLKGDPELVKHGWHMDCDIVIYRKGKLQKVQVSDWINRLEKKSGPPIPNVKITYEIKDVKVVGNAALVVVNIFYDGKLKFTDFMNLYKFQSGWKVATKTFFTHF